MNKQRTTHRLMKPILQYASVAGIVGLLAGCASDFDPGSRVTTLRVLAVQADQPFAAPGETVHLSALSYDPEGRAITWGWAACVNPLASTVEGCLAKIAADSEADGRPPSFATGTDMTTFDFTIPNDALSSLPAVSRPSAQVGIVSVACPGTLDLASSDPTIPFACRDAAGRELGLDEFVLGIKRVRVREGDHNENPVIASITFDGAAWPATEVKTVGHCDYDGNVFDDCNADEHDIAAYVTHASFESGQDEFGAAFREDLVTEYYATEGIFKDGVRISEAPTTRWVARETAVGRDLTLWFVVHDNRGGVSWDTRQVHVE
jgi:hypothetical protein